MPNGGPLVTPEIVSLIQRTILDVVGPTTETWPILSLSTVWIAARKPIGRCATSAPAVTSFHFSLKKKSNEIPRRCRQYTEPSSASSRRFGDYRILSKKYLVANYLPSWPTVSSTCCKMNENKTDKFVRKRKDRNILERITKMKLARMWSNRQDDPNHEK